MLKQLKRALVRKELPTQIFLDQKFWFSEKNQGEENRNASKYMESFYSCLTNSIFNQ